MRRIRPGTALPIALLALATLHEARADIYKWVDEDGTTHFTDYYRPGAVKVNSDFAPARGHAAPQKKRASSTPSPASFPKVTAAAQRERDSLRRQILIDERFLENRMLAEARADLANAARRPPADQERLRETVRRHEQNIQLLDKELGRVR
jgi:hypothetical protein